MHNIIKHKLSAIIAILLFAMPAKAQQVTADSLYLQAYTEIADMLDGKQPLSVKRAVFLSEWAYLGGKLDYQRDFCDEISRIANYIRDAYTEEIDRLSIHYWQMLESTYWTDVTEELDEQWANEWKTAPEPQILTREKYEQMMNKK